MTYVITVVSRNGCTFQMRKVFMETIRAGYISAGVKHGTRAWLERGNTANCSSSIDWLFNPILDKKKIKKISVSVPTRVYHHWLA